MWRYIHVLLAFSSTFNIPLPMYTQALRMFIVGRCLASIVNDVGNLQWARFEGNFHLKLYIVIYYNCYLEKEISICRLIHYGKMLQELNHSVLILVFETSKGQKKWPRLGLLLFKSLEFKSCSFACAYQACAIFECCAYTRSVICPERLRRLEEPCSKAPKKMKKEKHSTRQHAQGLSDLQIIIWQLRF